MNLANPIFQRELKERIRSRRAFVGFTVYLAVLAFILYVSSQGVERSSGGAFASAGTGRTVFQILLLGLLVLISFLVPAYAAGAISNERERQTFALVQVTLMSPRAIVLGKLGATMSWLLFLLFATLPFFSVGFILGGVTLGEMLKGIAAVIVVGFVLTTVGLALSSRVRRTSTAVIAAQGIVLALMAGTAMLYGVMQESALQAGRPRDATWVLTPNPVVAVAAAIGEPNRAGSGPFDAMSEVLNRRTFQVVGPGGPLTQPRQSSSRAGFLTASLVSYAVLTILSLRVATSAVRAPRHNLIVMRPRRRRVVRDQS